jgi:hypothetical protein
MSKTQSIRSGVAQWVGTLTEFLLVTIITIAVMFVIPFIGLNWLFRGSRIHIGPQTLRIAIIEQWTWKKRLATFLGVFGGLWLLLEPIPAFVSGFHLLSTWGWPGYIGLIAAALAVMMAIEWIYLRHQLGSMDFFTFYIEFVKSGKRLRVQAPRDLQISAFLERFIEEMSRVFDPAKCATLHLFTHNLLVKKPDGKFRPVRSTLTFREAAIGDGATCRLRGYIRAEYLTPSFELTLPGSSRREKGLAIMDELDSISLEQAEKKGALSQNALDHVHSFKAPASAWFVVLCPESDIEDDEELTARV